MKTVLFIEGGKVENAQPFAHFLLRIDAAIEYYLEHRDQQDITFLVTGRWKSVTESYELTESEVGKQYILTRIPEAIVIKEDISVELIGNFAFSKPLIESCDPDLVIIFTSQLISARNEQLAQRIFSDAIPYKVLIITNDLSDNPVLVEKERQALALFDALTSTINTGDDAAFRDCLLYKTPYYYKGVIDDKTYFDTYWEGGYDHYLHGREVRKAA